MEKHYEKGDVTIVWKPDICKHSAMCFGSLPEVFNPRVRPWIQPENANTQEVVAVVRQCPSGALSILGDEPLATKAAGTEVAQESEASGSKMVSVKVTKGGPYMVTGNVVVRHHDGTVTERTSVTALCRCGMSSKKPFCDGSHVRSDLDKGA